MAMFDSPYEDSYYYNPTGGTDADFLAYLKRLQAERRGGILGGGMFGSFTSEAAKEKAEVNAKDVLGELIKKRTGAGDDSGMSVEELAAFSADSAREGSPMNPYDRLSGRTFAPELWGLTDWMDSQAIRSDLLRSGYTEEQIDRILANPEVAKALASSGRIDTSNSGIPYDYNEAGKQETIGRTLGDIFGVSDTPANQYPFSPYAGGLFGSVGVGGVPYSGADIEAIRQAQSVGNDLLFRDINLPSLLTASERAVQGAEDARAREAARIEQARIAAEQQAAMERQAAALAASNTTSSISNPIVSAYVGGGGGTSTSWTPGSSGGSTTNYASSGGGTQTVGTGGGNASRGYSYGGW